MSLPEGSPGGATVLAVDSGGSGLRVAVSPLAAAGPGPAQVRHRHTPVPTGPRGIDAEHLLAGVRELTAGLAEPLRPVAVCVGAAGMATLGEELRERLPSALAAEFGVRRVALAADAVTAYAGALGQQPGAVVAAGTGLIAMGTDLSPAGGWRRADGWGHLLGDCGGGAWIGRAGLEAALREHDGRQGGSGALLERLTARFGAPAALPALLYPRTDRPALLASFAPDVAACAAGDPVAADILERAAAEIADAMAAVCPDVPGARIAVTGGLLRLGAPLTEPLHAALDKRLPRARETGAVGDPLHGALVVAAALAAGNLRLPVDGRLLHVPG
ncbi:N-acetylglucosamine kinase [Streptomyces sp. NPDC059740]|uniref:N-acetylglucosamine kinase n=1 Tax=Streptomyces sp. NPDC059740 TaxID=3346926 RepID=UPI003651D9CB